jgi:DNA-binding NarL/FixJ family response regulator
MARNICTVDGCQRPLSTRGLCHTHYWRWRRTGTTNPPVRTIDVLLALIATPSVDCIDWTRALATTGYGSIIHNGRKTHAHRVACLIAHGPPPPGREYAAHHCGRRICVNPAHLRWATALENHADKVTHGTDSRGVKHHHAKLTDEKVRQIRALAAQGKRNSDIAPLFGITGQTVAKVVLRQRWTHVDDGQAVA